MAVQVGVYEAKARLSELLEAVQHGERVTITNRGVPVADLVPSTAGDEQARRRDAVVRMRTFPKGGSMTDKELKAAREHGRK